MNVRAAVMAWCAVGLASPIIGAEGFEWRTEKPETHALATSKLDAFRAHLAAHATKALLIVRDDRIVYEWYAADHSATKQHYSASMAKALVGGVGAAVALSDGRLALDEPAAKYVSQWRADPVKSRITIRQLGSHTSGMEDAESGDLPHDKLTGWQGDFWKRLPPPKDPFTIARDVAPIASAPGERFQYSNPGIAMLGYVVTAALRDAPEKDIRTLLRDRIMRPIGVADSDWSCGYGGVVKVDDLPLIGTWGGGGYTARAAARVGRLMLREGNWEGRQLIKPTAVRAVTQQAVAPGTVAIGWWNNSTGRIAALPQDAFWAAGAGHQLVVVIPSLKTIIVRNGGALAPKQTYDDARNTLFFEPLMKALAP